MNCGIAVLRSSCIALLLAAAAISASAAGIAPLVVDTTTRRSGYDFMGREPRAMQEIPMLRP